MNLGHKNGIAPMQPLEGLKVLDFSTLTPGPIASLMLAEAGAQVVKTENPQGGDGLRGFPPARETVENPLGYRRPRRGALPLGGGLGGVVQLFQRGLAGP